MGFDRPAGLQGIVLGRLKLFDCGPEKCLSIGHRSGTDKIFL